MKKLLTAFAICVCNFAYGQINFAKLDFDIDAYGYEKNDTAETYTLRRVKSNYYLKVKTILDPKHGAKLEYIIEYDKKLVDEWEKEVYKALDNGNEEKAKKYQDALKSHKYLITSFKTNSLSQPADIEEFKKLLIAAIKELDDKILEKHAELVALPKELDSDTTNEQDSLVVETEPVMVKDTVEVNVIIKGSIDINGESVYVFEVNETIPKNQVGFNVGDSLGTIKLFTEGVVGDTLSIHLVLGDLASANASVHPINVPDSIPSNSPFFKGKILGSSIAKERIVFKTPESINETTSLGKLMDQPSKSEGEKLFLREFNPNRLYLVENEKNDGDTVSRDSVEGETFRKLSAEDSLAIASKAGEVFSLILQSYLAEDRATPVAGQMYVKPMVRVYDLTERYTHELRNVVTRKKTLFGVYGNRVQRFFNRHGATKKSDRKAIVNYMNQRAELEQHLSASEVDRLQKLSDTCCYDEDIENDLKLLDKVICEFYECTDKNTGEVPCKFSGDIQAKLKALAKSPLTKDDITQVVDVIIPEMVKYISQEDQFSLSSIKEHLIEVDDVQIEMSEGAIANISVKAHYFDRQNQRKEYVEFTNLYEIPFSTKKDVSFPRLIYLYNTEPRETRKVFLLDLQDLITYYPNYHVRSYDYSPADSVYNISIEKGATTERTFRKESRAKILKARVYTDFTGLEEDNPNGLLQFEIERPIYLNHNYNSFWGSFKRITPKFTFMKVENKAKHLDLGAKADTYSANTLKIFQHSMLSVGIDLNLVSVFAPRIKSKFELNVGSYVYRTPFSFTESVLDSTGVAQDVENTLDRHSWSIEPELRMIVYPHPNWGAEFYYRLMHLEIESDDVFQNGEVSGHGVDPMRVRFENKLFMSIYMKGHYRVNSRNEFYFRAGWHKDFFTSTNFLQVQVGYSIDISAKIKTPDLKL